MKPVVGDIEIAGYVKFNALVLINSQSKLDLHFEPL